MTASPYHGPSGALAAVLGGAVTRERLQRVAAREGRGDTPLIHSLLAQSLPSVEDLARAYRDLGGVIRLDSSFLRMAPRSGLLLDPELLRRERCVPIELFPDLCILAVEARSAAHAVETVRGRWERFRGSHAGVDVRHEYLHGIDYAKAIKELRCSKV